KELAAKEDVDAKELDTKVGELSESLQKIGQAAYQQQAGQSGQEQAEGTEEKTDEKKEDQKDVEEGEVVE
ncbi:MAG TPA: hypothetical protein PLS49_05770, partial [Candidatus Woesebacteria bacterium]|nr:hypothetical protein [Candidatus Woesebacteria bacterium]